MNLEKIKNDIKELMKSSELSFYNLEYVNEDSINILRLTVDSKEDIDVDDLETLSNVINEYLDKEDPIDEEYTFEVTSRGIERDFSFDEANDYLKEYIFVKTFEQSQYGILMKVTNDSISIKNGKNKIININANDIVQLRTAVKF